MKTAKKEKPVLGRILKYLDKYRISLAAALVLSAANVVCVLYAPIIIGNAIDAMADAGRVDFSLIYKYIGMLCVIALLAAAAQYLSQLCINIAAYGCIKKLRDDSFKKLNGVSLSYIDTHTHGDLLSRVVTDIDQISDGLIQGFSQLFSGIVTVALTIVFMVRINAVIALAVIFITPLSLFAAYFIASGSHKMFALQAKKRGEMSGLVNEMLSAQKTVRLFNYQSKAEKRFADINGELKICGQDAAFYSSMVNPTTRFINGLVFAAACILGIMLVLGADISLFGLSAGTLTVGGLSVFLSYANQYTKPFNEITGVVTELQTAFAGARRVFELLDAPEFDYKTECPAIGISLGEVNIDKVDFSYDKSRKVIKDFSLIAKSGNRIAIVGPTGCGKTTIINLLMRFYDTDSGTIQVDGQDITKVDAHSLRKSYGMVLQETWLKSASVRENIAYGKPDATDEEIIEAAKLARADSFIRRLSNGYGTVLGEDGGNMSTGQKQLLCIARVMLFKPPMLILDEATSNIDTRTELKIQDAFAKLMEGKTSFIVAHRLSTIKNADLIVVMKDGEIIEKGKHDELLTLKGFYYNLYNSQFEH